MSYTIKYIKLFEQGPFKKLTKTTGDNNDFDAIRKASRNALSNAVKSDIINLYRDLVLSGDTSNDDISDMSVFDEYINAHENEPEIKQFTSYFSRLAVIKTIMYSTGSQNGYFGDIDVNITNEAVEIIIPCKFLYSASTVLLFGRQDIKRMPRNICDKAYGYFFRDPKNGFTGILEKYGINNLPFKIRFKILNIEDVQMPVTIFYNYGDNTYINDFVDNFINMYTNFTEITTTAHSFGFNAYFIDCFGKSDDLNEINSLIGVYKNISSRARINIYVVYSDTWEKGILGCYNYVKAAMGSRIELTSRQLISLMRFRSSFNENPKITSIDKNLFSSVDKLTLKIIPEETLSNDAHKVLSQRGFSNKLINYCDEFIKSRAAMYITSEEQFRRRYKYKYYYADIQPNDDTIDDEVEKFKSTPKNSYIDIIECFSDTNIISYDMII